MVSRDYATQKLRLLLVYLSFNALLTTATVGETVKEGFSAGTTVTLTISSASIDRHPWFIQYGTVMPGTVSVSQHGTAGANQIYIYGRRDGNRYPGEPYWSMTTQTITLLGTSTSSTIHLPFGPDYPPQDLSEWIQTYKYTAKISAGTGRDTDSKILSVRSYESTGSPTIIDETL